jgi:hypothetical protein
MGLRLSATAIKSNNHVQKTTPKFDGHDIPSPQKIATPGQRGGDVGAHNYPIVKAWFAAHPCGTNREAARALGLSDMAVGRHVKRIRAEWGGV